MMKRIVGWFVLVPLCVVLVLFALSNRQGVVVRFDPVSSGPGFLPEFDVPLFVVIYAMLIVGIGLGGTAAWWAQGRHRRDKRRYRREVQNLTKEISDIKRKAPSASSDPMLLEDEDLLDKV